MSKKKNEDSKQDAVIKKAKVSPVKERKNSQNSENVLNYNVTMNPFDLYTLDDLNNRRLCLFGDIGNCDEDYGDGEEASTDLIIQQIMRYNREDMGLKPKERKPIWLYINSPGGDVIDGFSLVSTIATSLTPVYTVNLGQWSSMAFLIGITGRKRFALPHTIFLLHDGTTFAIGSSTKVQDKAEFNKRYEKEITRKHVLKYTKITSKIYEKNLRKEFYMLVDDALELGVIDKVVKNLDEIL